MITNGGRRTSAGQDSPQPGQVVVRRTAGPLGPPVRPDPIDELVDGHHPVDIDQQRHQNAPLSGMPDPHEAPVDTRLEASK